MPNKSNQPFFDIASLHKLRPEIVNTLKTVEYQLGEFIDDESTSDELADSVEAMEQLKAVLALINLAGSSEITDAIMDAISHLMKTADNTNKALIYAVSEGVMTLGRYIEFVLLREKIYPKLLLTAINNIRIYLHQPLLGESAFDDTNSIQTNDDFKPLQLGAASKFLQKTYRIGLSAALSNKDVYPTPAKLKNIKLMEPACQHALERIGGQFWETAFAAVAEIEKALPLTPSRKRALIYLESQFANTGESIDEKRYADLISMAVSRDNEKAVKLRDQYNIDTIIDTEFDEMSSFMYGPNADVVDTVNHLIQEEISKTKDLVDTEARSSEFNAKAFKEIAIEMRELSLRLYILGLKTAAEKVMIQAKVVSQWQETSPAQYKELLSALLYAENASILMAKSHTPGAVSLPLNNTGISLHQLDTAFSELVTQSRNTLANAVKGIEAYIGSVDKDTLHINNLPTMLSTVGGAMLFIDVVKGYKLLSRTATYVTRKLQAEQPLNVPVLEKLADVIMCADFYLESIQLKQPSGDQPLVIGAHSLRALLAA